MSAIKLASLADTETLARDIAARLKAGDTVTLRGDLGAGKTTFVQYLARALGCTAEVTSPTFTLLQTYPITYAGGEAGELWHYDLYRIDHPSALAELGFEEAADKLTVIEWPERMGAAAPIVTLALSFRLDKDGTRYAEVA